MAEIKTEIAVIGGGIIGVCCAITLLREGRSVAIVECEESGMGAVAASCWLIAPGEIVPLSRPGILCKTPGWLLNPNGPLSIRLAAIFSVLPWFLRFAVNATPSRISRIADALAALTRSARADYASLLHPLGLTNIISSRPVLLAFSDRGHFEKAQKSERRFMTERGFSVDVLQGQNLQNAEPALSPDICGAFAMNDWRLVADPQQFVSGLNAAVANSGGRRILGEAKDFESDGNIVRAVRFSNGKILRADKFILAAGARTKQLAARLGVRLPIMAAAGYRTILNSPGVNLRHAVNWAEGGFGIAPTPNGIAVAGTVEFCGPHSSPNFRRAKIIAKKARRILPGLRGKNSTEQVGIRPLCPDTLPIMDKLPGYPNVYIASGHGQLGLTLAATTARLIADLVSGRKSDIPLSPYRIGRFE